MQKKTPALCRRRDTEKGGLCRLFLCSAGGIRQHPPLLPCKNFNRHFMFYPPAGRYQPKGSYASCGTVSRRANSAQGRTCPSSPSFARTRHGKRAAGCPAALNGPRAFFLLPEKRRLFLPPKLPASGEKSPGMTAATSFPVCLIGKKPSRPGAFLTSFPPGKQASFRRRKAHGHNRASPAQGFVMRTSGRPAPRRKRRSSPPACIPPAHGPSGCRR